MRIVIAGGSGFIGNSLRRHFVERHATVTVLTRGAERDAGDHRLVHWDGRNVGAWAQHLDGADAIINLCGRSVDCRKTPDRCDEILRSRVEPTAAIGGALADCVQPPRVWVQMATAHIYGDPPVEWVDEDSAFGYGLAPEVGRAWEEACTAWRLPQTRTVLLRTSFVFGRHGGALDRLKALARFGLGGRLGHGRQGISWIHEHDLNRLFQEAVDNEALQGAYIASAPNPVSNAQFMRSLRRATGAPFGLPAAAWMVRLGARWLLDTDPELALYGRYCVSKRLIDEQFTFAFPDLDLALDDLMA